MRRLSLAAALSVALGLVLAGAPPAVTSAATLELDASTARVGFTLGATLHTVEGTVRVAEGRIDFDVESGTASGQVVLDATSADTRMERRDRKMHRDVLESERHPRIVFRAERIRVLERQPARAEIELTGTLELHGERRPFTVPARLERAGDRVRIDSRFRVPYVEWGVRDPSSFLLRVDPFVEVTVEAEGRLHDAP